MAYFNRKQKRELRDKADDIILKAYEQLKDTDPKSDEWPSRVDDWEKAIESKENLVKNFDKKWYERLFSKDVARALLVVGAATAAEGALMAIDRKASSSNSIEDTSSED